MKRAKEPAFPNGQALANAGGPAGLSVREWGAFTIAAGMCAHPDSVPESDDTPMAVARTNVAINAVKTVDAVLAVLAEPAPSVVVAPTLPDDVRQVLEKFVNVMTLENNTLRGVRLAECVPVARNLLTKYSPGGDA